MRIASILGLGAAASFFLASGTAFADPPPAAGTPVVVQPGATVVIAPNGAVTQGYPPPGYGPPPPGYGAPPPGYGAPPPGYGAAPPGYTYAPAPGYGYPPPPPGYGYAPAPGYAYGPPIDVAPKERRSSGMMAGGIVMISVGGLGLIIGSALALSSGSSCSFDFSGSCSRDTGAQTAGYGMMIGGIISVAVGIPLLVYGAKKVPVRPEGAPAPAAALATPAWIGAPAGQGWQWKF